MTQLRTAMALLAAAAAISGCGKADSGAPNPPVAVPPGAPTAADVAGIPAPATTRDPTPAAPIWASGWLGRQLGDVFPKRAVCRGNTDFVTLRYTGQPAGVQIRGWAFDPAAKAHVEQVIVVMDGRIAGAGAGGLSRPQVMAKVPEVTDPKTQWFATAPRTSGYAEAYGVVAPDTVCPLGHVSF